MTVSQGIFTSFSLENNIMEYCVLYRTETFSNHPLRRDREFSHSLTLKTIHINKILFPLFSISIISDAKVCQPSKETQHILLRLKTTDILIHGFISFTNLKTNYVSIMLATWASLDPYAYSQDVFIFLLSLSIA